MKKDAFAVRYNSHLRIDRRQNCVRLLRVRTRAVVINVAASLQRQWAGVIIPQAKAIAIRLLSRAIAAGSGPRNFSSWGEALGNGNFLNPLKAAETMTGHIVRISGGDLSYETIEYDSIFAIALTLFIMTMILNLISRWVVRRFRQEY